MIVNLQSLLLGLLGASAASAHVLPPVSSNTANVLTERANPSSGCGKAPFNTGVRTVSVNGKNRQFQVRVPAGYDRNKHYKLIFAFHWVGGTMNDISGGGSDRQLWSYYGLQRQAAESAILVAPQGLNNGWGNSGGEDVNFVDAMIKDIESNLCVDQRQRFSLGFSYGGAMTYAVACGRAKDFRAVAVLGGGQLSGCSGGNDPVAYLGIHGLNDGTLNISGGKSMRDRFVKNNGCASTNAPDPGRNSGKHVKTVFDGCKTGYPVTWISFDGGHIPAPVDNGPESGAKSYIPGEIWSFFTQAQLQS